MGIMVYSSLQDFVWRSRAPSVCLYLVRHWVVVKIMGPLGSLRKCGDPNFNSYPQV